jgi:hypothetical protein
MTTQDSTHRTDQYEGRAPEGSYSDQHSSDSHERDSGDAPVTDTAEQPDDGARGSRGDASAEHAANGSGARADTGRGSSDRGPDDAATTLIPADRAGEFNGRWTEMKADFVDEPRDTVRKIDGLVGEVLDELNEIFKHQRSELERDMKNDEASTEDLRVAFGRYRQFFERLLSV